VKHLWPVLFSLLGLACERTEVRTIELTVAERSRELDLPPLLAGETGDKVHYDSYAGFGCLDVQNADGTTRFPTMMVARAYDLQHVLLLAEVPLRASVVVDTIRLGGYPRCRATEILNFCAARDCSPIASERRCFDLPRVTVPIAHDLRADTEKLLNVFHRYIKEGLKDALVTSDAVDEEVIMRLVGTTETCDELDKKGSLAFDPTKLLGCNYSCPIVPTAVRGEVLLDLDALTSFCEPVVRACAAATFSPGPEEQTTIGGVGQGQEPAQ
jgi:hypothetical protein